MLYPSAEGHVCGRSPKGSRVVCVRRPSTVLAFFQCRGVYLFAASGSECKASVDGTAVVRLWSLLEGKTWSFENLDHSDSSRKNFKAEELQKPVIP